MLALLAMLALTTLLTLFRIHAFCVFRHLFHFFVALGLAGHTVPILRILTHSSLSFDL